MRFVLLFVLAGCRIGFDEQPAIHDADITAPDGSERCPRGRGPDMTLMPSGFCIDNTEVTVAQYNEFLAAALPVDTSGPCAFNTSYEVVSWVRNAFTDPSQPVAGIDWCDARDFCAWAGKRLCGRLGGGSLGYDDYATNQAQWYVACSLGGAQRYVYGNQARTGACHLDNPSHDVGTQAPVATFPECVVTGTRVYDLLGNLQEWTDACTEKEMPEEDRCRVMGGVWYFGSQYVDCYFADPSGGVGIPRAAADYHTGFRCCAD